LKFRLRSYGPALAGALLLHGAALVLFGLHSHERLSPPTVREVVVQLVEPPRVTPPEPPPAAPKPRPLPLPVAKPLPPPTAAPVLATSAPVAPSPVAPAPVVAAPPAPSPPPMPPLPVSAPRFDAAYLDNPKPEYPLMARRNGDEGKVVLRVHVTEEGRAAEVQLHSTSGSSALDKAARSAVQNWRFVPARQGAQAVSAWVLVPVVFKLQD